MVYITIRWTDMNHGYMLILVVNYQQCNDYDYYNY